MTSPISGNLKLKLIKNLEKNSNNIFENYLNCSYKISKPRHKLRFHFHLVSERVKHFPPHEQHFLIRITTERVENVNTARERVENNPRLPFSSSLPLPSSSPLKIFRLHISVIVFVKIMKIFFSFFFKTFFHSNFFFFSRVQLF